jgi:heptosyltransferase-2
VLQPPQRLLVRLPSWLGDLVMAEPVVRALYERWEAAGAAERISLAAPAHLLPVLEGRFAMARRIPHVGRGGERAADWRGHDAALLLAGSFRSAWTAWRAGIPERIGWRRDWRGPLLTLGARPALERGGVPLGVALVRGRPRYLPRPYSDDCAELLALAGLFVRDPRPRLVPAEGASGAVDARLSSAGFDGAELVVACVGAREGSAKAYPPERWAAALGALGRRVALVGGSGEEAPVRAVAAALPSGSGVALIDPVLDLPELVALCARARLVLAADSGSRHVAAASGAPVVCMVGPTDPRWGSWDLETTLLVREEVPCGPCHLERCPLSGEERHACMLRIEPERVAALAEAQLG